MLALLVEHQTNVAYHYNLQEDRMSFVHNLSHFNAWLQWLASVIEPRWSSLLIITSSMSFIGANDTSQGLFRPLSAISLERMPIPRYIPPRHTSHGLSSSNE